MHTEVYAKFHAFLISTLDWGGYWTSRSALLDPDGRKSPVELTHMKAGQINPARNSFEVQFYFFILLFNFHFLTLNFLPVYHWTVWNLTYFGCVITGYKRTGYNRLQTLLFSTAARSHMLSLKPRSETYRVVPAVFCAFFVSVKISIRFG